MPRYLNTLLQLTHWLRYFMPLLLIFYCSAVLRPVIAANRALLIGVGQYTSERIPNLDGVALDLKMMREVANLLGFADSEIKVLQDAQATETAVHQAIQTWLIDGTSPNDRILFYFSGHGAQIPDINKDESDDRDEVLVLHDGKIVTQNGEPTLTGVLLDDRLQIFLNQMSDRQVFMLVDACHSGTFHKGITVTKHLGQAQVQAKVFKYSSWQPPRRHRNRSFDWGQQLFGTPTRPRRYRSSRAVTAELLDTNTGQYAALAAANDNEEALDSKNGGYFTIGVWRAIRARVEDRQQAVLNFTTLQQEVTAYLQSELKPKDLYHPQLNGNPHLLAKALPIQAPITGQGANWQRLLALYQRAGRHFVMTPNSSQHHIGRDHLELRLEIPKSGGYLNIVNIGPKDEATILFPNAYQTNNYVNGGSLHWPGINAAFRIGVPGPAGANLIIAFVSERPVDLRKKGFATESYATTIFRELIPASTETLRKAIRSYEVQPAGPKVWAAKIETQVMP
ncbi:hypothetical protein TI05_06300 [Achromatium sp. WMS3]|nr:hypothetical protein TI05_06300 [Achromatium sp. WMS3]